MNLIMDQKDNWTEDDSNEFEDDLKGLSIKEEDDEDKLDEDNDDDDDDDDDDKEDDLSKNTDIL